MIQKLGSCPLTEYQYYQVLEDNTRLQARIEKLKADVDRLNAVLDDCVIHIRQSEASSTLIGAVADVYYYERNRILNDIKTVRNKGAE